MGTSTPTSMTVVATSTGSAPALNCAITAALSAGFMRPCSRPTPMPGSASASAAWVSVTFCSVSGSARPACSAAAFSASSDSSISGQTQ